MWLLATGALMAKNSQHKSQSYSHLIHYYNKDFPTPNYQQIEVDLPRTFPEEEYYKSKENR